MHIHVYDLRNLRFGACMKQVVGTRNPVEFLPLDFRRPIARGGFAPKPDLEKRKTPALEIKDAETGDNEIRLSDLRGEHSLVFLPTMVTCV
jgi:hypothetical protein